MPAKPYGASIVVASTDLTGPTADTWMALVFRNLRHLHVTETGGTIIDYLNAQPKPVGIIPYTDTVDRVNANATAAFEADAYYPGRPVRDGKGLVLSPKQVGTGAGSGCTVRFTPWRFRWANLPEATLLHELVHAAEHASGRMYTNPIGWRYDTQAEFDAILIENMYRSEKNLNLRANHHGWDKLVGWLPVPDVGQYRKLLISFRARMPALTERLARLNIGFNPFRPGAQGYIAL